MIGWRSCLGGAAALLTIGLSTGPEAAAETAAFMTAQLIQYPTQQTPPKPEPIELPLFTLGNISKSLGDLRYELRQWEPAIRLARDIIKIANQDATLSQYLAEELAWLAPLTLIVPFCVPGQPLHPVWITLEFKPAGELIMRPTAGPDLPAVPIPFWYLIKILELNQQLLKSTNEETNWSALSPGLEEAFKMVWYGSPGERNNQEVISLQLQTAIGSSGGKLIFYPHEMPPAKQELMLKIGPMELLLETVISHYEALFQTDRQALLAGTPAVKERLRQMHRHLLNRIPVETMPTDMDGLLIGRDGQLYPFNIVRTRLGESYAFANPQKTFGVTQTRQLFLLHTLWKRGGGNDSLETVDSAQPAGLPVLDFNARLAQLLTMAMIQKGNDPVAALQLFDKASGLLTARFPRLP